MQRVKEIIGKVAVTDSPVLIEGESGTGKELVAAAIHRLSPRAKRPFIPVNCSAIPQDLLESEFFGHVRGAFSGAVADAMGLFRGADEGTIFLDEIAELSPSLQVKLLRVLQEMQVRPVGSTKAYPVDVRVIAATNRDLERAMTEGVFRQDLFYRLNVVRVLLPPLRDRREDVVPLVNHFIRRFNRRFHRELRGLTPDAQAALTAYSFPGNVRELENLVERAYAMGAREQITLTDLGIAVVTRGAAARPLQSAQAREVSPRYQDGLPTSIGQWTGANILLALTATPMTPTTQLFSVSASSIETGILLGQFTVEGSNVYAPEVASTIRGQLALLLTAEGPATRRGTMIDDRR